MSACVSLLKEAMQQWYHHYQAAQAHTYSTAAPQDSAATDYSKEHTQVRARYFLFNTLSNFSLQLTAGVYPQPWSLSTSSMVLTRP